MPKSPKTYEKFINDDWEIIKDEFEKQGYPVRSGDDFTTYVGWKERDRVVKRGEVATHFKTTQKYSHPVFRYGGIVRDEKGKQQFHKYHHDFNLFHRNQTEPLNQCSEVRITKMEPA